MPSSINLLHVKNVNKYEKGAIVNSLLKFAKWKWVQV